MNKGPALMAVLAAAHRKFGPKADPQQVGEWVRRRLRQLEGKTAEVMPFTPRDFDAKARAAGDGDDS